MATNRGPFIANVEPIIQAGIDPKTGLQIKMGSQGCALKENIRRQLRVLDGQDAQNRYTWYNLPSGLTGQLIERVLYYRGQGAFFYMSANDTYYFLPYALNGNIDVYGRFLGITPLPFRGTTESNKNGKEEPFIVGLVKTPVYDLISVIGEDINSLSLDQLKDLMWKLQYKAYVLSEVKEKSSLKAELAETIQKEKAAQRFMEVDGTAGAKANMALIDTSEETVVQLLYENVSSQLKTKLDQLHRLVNVIQSILMTRMQEAKLSISSME